MSVTNSDASWTLPAGYVVAGEYFVEAQAYATEAWVSYRGHHTERQTEIVSITTLRSDAPSAAYIDAFARRSQWLAKVSIPHIPKLLASGVEMGFPVIVTSWVDGPTLREVLDEEGSLPRAEALEIIRAVGEAMDAMHALSPPIVHLLLSLDTIRVDRVTRAPRILDAGFAAALLAARVEDVHEAAQIKATFRAPEDVAGRSPQPASDRYALGQLAEVLLAPVPAATPLARVLARATASVPVARFPSCLSFAQALSAALTAAPSISGLKSSSRTPSVPELSIPSPVRAPSLPSSATKSPSASSLASATKSPSASSLASATKSASEAPEVSTTTTLRGVAPVAAADAPAPEVAPSDSARHPPSMPPLRPALRASKSTLMGIAPESLGLEPMSGPPSAVLSVPIAASSPLETEKTERTDAALFADLVEDEDPVDSVELTDIDLDTLDPKVTDEILEFPVVSSTSGSSKSPGPVPLADAPPALEVGHDPEDDDAPAIAMDLEVPGISVELSPAVSEHIEVPPLFDMGIPVPMPIAPKRPSVPVAARAAPDAARGSKRPMVVVLAAIVGLVGGIAGGAFLFSKLNGVPSVNPPRSPPLTGLTEDAGAVTEPASEASEDANALQIPLVAEPQDAAEPQPTPEVADAAVALPEPTPSAPEDAGPAVEPEDASPSPEDGLLRVDGHNGEQTPHWRVRGNARRAMQVRVSARCHPAAPMTARFAVQFTGSTGQVARVELFGPALHNTPLGACVEAAVRTVALPTFVHETWDTDYAVELR
ncbi:MAG: protein kinase [Deltaproteobacteria bacterium]|nr:protein kinase [Deltaproteobacteria bacterium]